MSAEVFTANWKLAGGRKSSGLWVEAFNAQEGRELLTPTSRIIVAPPLALLSTVADQIARYGLPIAIAAQHLDLEADGVKHTGQGHVPALIADCAEYVILGHTETRKDKKLTLDDINERLDLARKHNLKPIVCVANIAQAAAIAGHDSDFPGVIAYEPPGNIGTVAADPAEANDVCRRIAELYPQARVLYGGSVDAQNVNRFLAQPSISGVLVGDKSSNPDFFQNILRATTQQHLS